MPASTKFWELEKRIRNDKKTPGVSIELRKSEMFWDIASLIHDGVINLDDLKEFGDEVREAVRLILGR